MLLLQHGTGRIYGESADFSSCIGPLQIYFTNAWDSATFNIESFATHPNLTAIQVHHTRCHGCIDVFKNHPTLQALQVHYLNNGTVGITGNIESMATCPNLTAFLCDSSGVIGSVNSFANHPNLQVLYVNKPGNYPAQIWMWPIIRWR